MSQWGGYTTQAASAPAALGGAAPRSPYTRSGPQHPPMSASVFWYAVRKASMRTSRCAGPCTPARCGRGHGAVWCVSVLSELWARGAGGTSSACALRVPASCSGRTREDASGALLGLPSSSSQQAQGSGWQPCSPDTTTTQSPSTPWVRRVPLCTLYLQEQMGRQRGGRSPSPQRAW